ncbi:MAG: ACT domain-containing protein [Candidatus Micrarchaeota archaeon]
MKEFVIVTNDRVGLLADISGALAKRSINIEGIDVTVIGKKAVCRVLTRKKDEADAKNELEKAGFKVLDSDVIVVKLANKPGELSNVARKLADSGVSINNAHLLGAHGEDILYALEVNKTTIARELLASYLHISD